MHQNLLVVDQYKVSEIVSLSFVFLLITLVLSSFVRPHFVNQSDLISAKYLLNKLKARLVKNYLEKDKNEISHNKNLPQSSLSISTTGASHDIIVVINPLCVQCGEHYQSSFFIQNTSSTCNIKYIFLYGNQLQFESVKSIYSAIENGQDFRTILLKWYSIRSKTDIKKFINQYNKKTISENSLTEIQAK